MDMSAHGHGETQRNPLPFEHREADAVALPSLLDQIADVTMAQAASAGVFDLVDVDKPIVSSTTVTVNQTIAQGNEIATIRQSYRSEPSPVDFRGLLKKGSAPPQKPREKRLALCGVCGERSCSYSRWV